MCSDRLNPYQTPKTVSEGRGHAFFRLRRWFAVAMYLVLVIDFVVVWTFGSQPFLVSIPTFILILATSVLMRRNASIRLDDAGIEYRDLVQFVLVSWDRVVGITHKPTKTTISTDAAMVQITVSRRHAHYQTIMRKLDEMQTAFGFESSGARGITDSESVR